jgi:Kef-type K+ transport system membrane component KefB
MVSESARTLQLLRDRDKQKRSRQVWIGLLVIWGVVVGWLVFFVVRAATPDASPLLAWLAYLIPLGVLAGIALAHVRRLRDIDAELVASTEADRKRG